MANKKEFPKDFIEKEQVNSDDKPMAADTSSSDPAFISNDQLQDGTDVSELIDLFTPSETYTEDLIVFQDKDNNKLGGFDGNGYFKAKIKAIEEIDKLISVESISDDYLTVLADANDSVILGIKANGDIETKLAPTSDIPIKSKDDNLKELIDSNGNMYGYFDKEGVFFGEINDVRVLYRVVAELVKRIEILETK